MDAASSKCYSMLSHAKDAQGKYVEKYSAKGVQGQAVTDLLTRERTTFSDIINRSRKGEEFTVTNKGFRVQGGHMSTYQQTKAPVNQLYIKRRIRGNGTLPLKGIYRPFRVVDRKRKAEQYKEKMKAYMDDNKVGPTHPAKKAKKAQKPPPALQPARARQTWQDRAMACNDVMRDMGYVDDSDMLSGSEPEDGVDC